MKFLGFNGLCETVLRKCCYTLDVHAITSTLFYSNVRKIRRDTCRPAIETAARDARYVRIAFYVEEECPVSRISEPVAEEQVER